ncbi:MAG: ATP-dependent Clp protease proteolytic subunit, partial [Candidatus Omnitrophica bacterium]|nr:ATP-dependent Clp protease proteolytic subunit [Candidatus Omnitrophota bacterium]
MPTWGEILKEIQTPPENPDSIRRKYLTNLSNHTGRDVILYSTKWTDPAGINPDVISITEEDIQGFMEVVHGLRRTKLDLIIHSPGGSPAATEAIVKYLRKKFTDIRIIVPQGAMSAGTMLACAGNRIVMGKHSFLGPIDPQFILPYVQGTVRMVPAQAILDQFKLAKEECLDNKNLGPWLPILAQYGPGLLIECKNAIALSKKLVQDWLKQFMFKGMPRAAHKANLIAKRLAAHTDHKSHSRHLDREECREWGLIIDDLETDQVLQDLVLSVFHAATITFSL